MAAVVIAVLAVVVDGKKLVKVDELLFTPFSAAKAADAMLLGSPSAATKKLAARIKAAAEHQQALVDAAKAAAPAPTARPAVTFTWPEGTDFGVRMPYDAFKALSPAAQRDYSRRHREALAAAAPEQAPAAPEAAPSF